jgi:hypothetical protein
MHLDALVFFRGGGGGGGVFFGRRHIKEPQTVAW